MIQYRYECTSVQHLIPSARRRGLWPPRVCNPAKYSQKARNWSWGKTTVENCGLQKQPQVWAALEIKPFVSCNISWSVLEESSSFWNTLPLSCVMFQSDRCLVQDNGMTSWHRLAVSGIYLCFSPWKVSGEKWGLWEANRQPVLPVMSLNISSVVGSASFSLWDAEIGSVLRDSVGSETNTSALSLHDLTKLNRLQWSCAGLESWRTGLIGHEELPTADEAIHHPLLLLAIEGFLNQEE